MFMHCEKSDLFGLNPGHGDPCGLAFARDLKNRNLRWNEDRIDIDGFLEEFYPREC